ncbi:predicted protein [Sclerotinia sclerotiorum 1980 UF-70]|uniref:Uncharacterized protein n=1 Tax=Sclerotinia sclerotiorum (strain ATCC 18683 / 1980 / Ss-1) TaxID=665079 RepID=A7EHA0_SCLS1|nr:predicted protein [Sclerotinia sclerotiorum 1980 UF-70]EDO02216.1 predicted protein [Sclerotinia sclerotiorum 1980 UF-70]
MSPHIESSIGFAFDIPFPGNIENGPISADDTLRSSLLPCMIDVAKLLKK